MSFSCFHASTASVSQFWCARIQIFVCTRESEKKKKQREREKTDGQLKKKHRVVKEARERERDERGCVFYTESHTPLSYSAAAAPADDAAVV